MNALCKEVAGLLVNRGGCVALTGAGISAESGIATFRSKGGLWEKYDPMVYASAEVFNDLVGSRDRRLVKIDGAHVAIMIDPRTRPIWTQMSDFLLES